MLICEELSVLNYLHMGGRWAKLNVKTQEEPMEDDEDEEEAEDEAFERFSVVPFQLFSCSVFFFCLFSFHFHLSLPVLSCSFEKLRKINASSRVSPCLM